MSEGSNLWNANFHFTTLVLLKFEQKSSLMINQSVLKILIYSLQTALPNLFTVEDALLRFDAQVENFNKKMQCSFKTNRFYL